MYIFLSCYYSHLFEIVVCFDYSYNTLKKCLLVELVVCGGFFLRMLQKYSILGAVVAQCDL